MPSKSFRLDQDVARSLAKRPTAVHRMTEKLDADAALDRFLRLATLFGPSGQEGAVAQAIVTELHEAAGEYA